VTPDPTVSAPHAGGPGLPRRANDRNGSTALGRALAGRTTDALTPHRDGLLLATGYRPRWPLAAALTVGDVVLLRAPLEVVLAHDAAFPNLLDHERRHAEQYARWGGVPFLLAYGLAAGWSYLRCRDWWSRNTFERAAGLADGGSLETPTVWPRPRGRRRAGRG
jgi:hypothetical protein